MSGTKRVVAFYHHSPCIDGSAAAWAMNEAFKDKRDVRLTFVPLDNGAHDAQKDFILAHIKDGDDVYFLDISPKEQALQALLRPEGSAPTIRSLTVIDHHATEVERLKSFEARHLVHADNRVRFILDPLAPAAALMTWQHFHPTKPAPKLLSWVGRMECSTTLREYEDFAIAAYIDSYNISTPEKAFESISTLLGVKRKDMVVQGDAVLKQQIAKIAHAIDTTLRYTHLEVLPDQYRWIPIVNLKVRESGRVVDLFLLSTAKERLVQHGINPQAFKIAAAWYVDEKDVVQLSLRSSGTPAVGPMAQYLSQTIGISGGGHARAACVQFQSSKQFFDAVPLYTKAEMLALQKDVAQPPCAKPLHTSASLCALTP